MNLGGGIIMFNELITMAKYFEILLSVAHGGEEEIHTIII
jgi:hypothetical protein